MVVRARPINWSLLLNPTMAGLQMEAEASARLGQSIAGVGQNIGAGIANRRQEAESKRRFGEELSLKRDELSLRTTIHEDTIKQKALDRQAAEQATTEELAAASEALNRLYSTTGQVDPSLAERVTKLTDWKGGPAAAKKALDEYAGSPMPLPPATPENVAANPEAYRTPPMVPQQGDPDFGKPLRPDYGRPPAPADADMVRTMPQSGGVSLRPQGTVGVLGFEDAPSEVFAMQLADLDTALKAADRVLTIAARDMSPRSVKGHDAQALARLTYNEAFTKRADIAKERAAIALRLATAKTRETTATALQAKEAEKAEKVKVQRQILGIMFKSDKYAHFAPEDWALAAEYVEREIPAKDAMALAEDERVKAVREEGNKAFAKESLKTPQEIETERLKAEAESVRAQREINTGTTPESIGGFRGATQGETATTKAETSGAETPAEKRTRTEGERSEKEEMARKLAVTYYKYALAHPKNPDDYDTDEKKRELWEFVKLEAQKDAR